MLRRATSAALYHVSYSFPFESARKKVFSASQHPTITEWMGRRHGRDSDSKFSESRCWWDKNSNLDAEGKRKPTITITGALFLAALWSTWMHSCRGECFDHAAISFWCGLCSSDFLLLFIYGHSGKNVIASHGRTILASGIPKLPEDDNFLGRGENDWRWPWRILYLPSVNIIFLSSASPVQLPATMLAKFGN